MRPYRFHRIPIVYLLLAVASCSDSTPRDSLNAAPRVKLSTAGELLSAEFARINSVRELSGGDLLVVDDTDARLLYAASFENGTVQLLGRQGSGPGEYRQLGRLLPLGDDSTLVMEPFSQRGLLLHGTAIVQSVQRNDPIGSFITLLSRAVGADSLGSLSVLGRARDATGRPSSRDSLVLVRLNRTSARIDTIARLQSEEGWKSARGSARPAEVAVAAGGQATGPQQYVIALSAPDEAAHFPDGWIALVRANPYRVDWCPPDDVCRPGPLLPGSPVRLTDREKRAYLDAVNAINQWPPTRDPEMVTGWPTDLPIFSAAPGIEPTVLFPLPDGRLAVERLPSADSPERFYDIVDRAGRLVLQVALPLTQRLVGFGSRGIYVVTVDSVGIERLSRHAFP